VKNKIAPPFRDAEFDIMFNEGISASGDLLDMAVESNVVDKSGAWYSYGEIRVGQGREKAKEFMRENPDLFAEIRAKVMDIRAPKPKKQDPAQDPAENIAEEDEKGGGEGGGQDGAGERINEETGEVVKV